MTKHVAVVVVLGLLAGCTSGSHPVVPSATASTTLRISSPDFADGAPIPSRFTCDGADAAPTIRWSGNESGELVLEMTDPDAGGFVHWLAYGFGEPTGTVAGTTVLEGRNDFGTTGYRGPCPPKGDDPHHYVFALYAVPPGASPIVAGEGPEAVLGKPPVAMATLTGTYARR